MREVKLSHLGKDKLYDIVVRLGVIRDIQEKKGPLCFMGQAGENRLFEDFLGREYRYAPSQILFVYDYNYSEAEKLSSWIHNHAPRQPKYTKEELEEFHHNDS